MEQNVMLRAELLHRQTEQIIEQIKYLDQNIIELQQHESFIESFFESKQSDIIAALGKGIFFRAEKKHGEKFLLSVGAGVFVQKTDQEAKTSIQKNITNLHALKQQLHEALSEVYLQLEKLMQDS